MKITSFTRLSRLLSAALLMLAAFAAPAVAIEIQSLQVIDRSSNYAVGSVSGEALTLEIEGVGKAAFGTGAGYVAYHRATETIRVPVIDDKLLVACSSADAISVSSTSRCISRKALNEAGADVSKETTSVLEDSLFQSGITERKTTDATTTFRQPISSDSLGKGLLSGAGPFLVSELGMNLSDATPGPNPQGFARSSSALVPDVASSQASCDARVGTGPVSASASGFTLPAPLAPVISGDVAKSSCSIVRGDASSLQRPDLELAYGEIDLEVTANETVIDATPAQVDALIDTLVATVPPAVAEILEDLRGALESQPLAVISMAPGTSDVTTNESGAISNSVTGDVEIEILGGLATILVSRSTSSASVIDSVPAATGACALATVTVLDLSTAQPDDVISRTVDCPSQSLSLLGGLPEPIGDSLKIDIATGQLATTSSCDGPMCRAVAGASTLSISMFGGDILPTVSLDIASSGALTEVSAQSEGTKVALPVTGEATLPVVGLSLAAAAVLVRRRVR